MTDEYSIILVDVLHRKQGEMFKKLKEENWHLNSISQTLSSQLEQTKQQMKELQLQVKKLEKENGQFKETVQNSQNDGRSDFTVHFINHCVKLFIY